MSGGDALAWARTAAQLAGCGESYRGRSLPHWYDGEAFFDLLQAAGDRSVRELVAELDGCTGARAGRIARAFKGRSCSSLGRTEAATLLEAAQQEARPVSAQRLGHVGEVPGWPRSHARGEGTFRCGRSGGPSASIPFVVEAWATAGRDGTAITTPARCWSTAPRSPAPSASRAGSATSRSAAAG